MTERQLNTSILVKWKCRFCDAKAEEWMTIKDARHEARQHHLTIHKRDCSAYYYILLMPPIYRDRNVLTRMYWGEELSTEEIANVFKVSSTTILEYMKKFDIPLRDEHERGKLAMQKVAQEQKLKRWTGQEDSYNSQRKKAILNISGVIK